MTEEGFDRALSLNVKAPYFLVAELAPLMAKRGKGAIVNLSTMAADYGEPRDEPLWFEQSRRQPVDQKLGCSIWAEAAVRVNVVSPGPTRTEGTDAMGEGLEQLAAQAPAGDQPPPTRLLRRLSSWRRTAQFHLWREARCGRRAHCCSRGLRDSPEDPATVGGAAERWHPGVGTSSSCGQVTAAQVHGSVSGVFRQVTDEHGTGIRATLSPSRRQSTRELSAAHPTVGRYSSAGGSRYRSGSPLFNGMDVRRMRASSARTR